MTKMLSMVAAACLVITVAVVVVMAQARVTRPAWEFKEIELEEMADSTPMLNREGANGWELVNVISSCTLTSLGSNFENPKSKCRYFAYFKRSK